MELGLQTLRDQVTPAVNIVFVHGLNTNRELPGPTLVSPASWPHHFLGADLPPARLLGFGYEYPLKRSSDQKANV